MLILTSIFQSGCYKKLGAALQRVKTALEGQGTMITATTYCSVLWCSHFKKKIEIRERLHVISQ